MISKFESLILGMFFGMVPVVFFLLATIVIASIFFGVEAIGPWTLWSVVPAAIIDIIFLKRCVRNAYRMNNKILAAIYIFYSVIIIGMQMGLPVLNFVLGIMAGVYIARKMHFIKADEQSRNLAFRRTAIFIAAAMVMVCCLITLWAIAGEMPHAQVKTPYLSFTFTVPIFSLVVLSGGAVLVILQYFLTRISAKVTIKLWP